MIPSHHLSLKLIQRCPGCKTAFQQARISILRESTTSILAHLNCVKCGVNLLANVVNMPQGLIGNAILTDLNEEEVLSLLSGEALSEDDFLNLYNIIHNKKIINDFGQSGEIPLNPGQ